MTAFRIVYTRPGAIGPESITAGFDSLEQAMAVFATRGLRILYIAESGLSRRPAPLSQPVSRPESGRPPSISQAYPLRRFSGRVMA